MKFFAVALVVCTIGMSKVNAQHEAKANILGAIFNQFEASYEYILDENMGILISGAYIQNPGSFISYDYSGFSVTPEFRYYFNPKNEDATGFFASGYLRYRNTKTELLDIKWTTNGMGVGFTLGYKFVTDFGLVLEAGLGYGRYVINNRTFDTGDDEDDEVLEEFYAGLPSYIFRSIVNVGYRF